MSYYEESPRKRLVMAVFIAVYLLPLSLLFALVITASNTTLLGRVAIVSGFGLPLIALWISVLKYPLFKKDAPPFPSRSVRSKLTLFLLFQGVMVVTVSIAVPLYLRTSRGYPGLGDGMLAIIGFAGIPAALFSLGVLLKAWKESSNAT